MNINLRQQCTIWLVDAIDLIGVQKLNLLPSYDPLRQISKLCLAMGMNKIRLKYVAVKIRGRDVSGCLVFCRGFDVVPFVSGVYSETLITEEFELIPTIKMSDDDTTYH